MSHIEKISTYLQSLPSKDYAIPTQIANAINYLLDGYFKKSIEISSISDVINPSVQVKESWIGCEIHRMVSLNGSYPSFAKAKYVWAFARMFENKRYFISPFLDIYEHRKTLKGHREYQIQQEVIQIDPNRIMSLPVYGTFFVEDELKTRLIVSFDFAYETMSCCISVMSAPENKPIAEKFLTDFNMSVEENDIHFGQCLTFTHGFLEFTSVPNIGWDEIILKDKVIKEIRDNSIGIIANMDKFTALGMTPNRNVMLISPPGMAKTTIFKAVCSEMNHVTRIWCTGKSINDSSDVTALFEAARSLAPSIVFIEDMDLFGKDRSTLSGYEGQILNEFLACLDGIFKNSGVIVMASTNDIKSMDEALTDRPGRFDVKIEIPYPDAIDRGRMLSSFLKRINAIPDNTVTKEILKAVVDLTDGLTGAYIKELANSITIHAVSDGNFVNNGILFSAANLNVAVEQVMRNYKIGKATRKKMQAEVVVT